MMNFMWKDIVVVTVALSLGGLHLYTRTKEVPLPPGPKGYPLIGNVFDMPASQSWKKFLEWGERYGGIMSITLLCQPFIIISDPVIAELLDRWGNTYADHPMFEMASLCGWDRVLSRFKEYRKLISRVIGTRGSIEKFYHIEEYQGNMFLKHVLEDPSAFESATRKSAAAMVLQLTYENDPWVDLADKGMSELSEIMRPGAFLIEVLPILKYSPAGSLVPTSNVSRKKYNHSCDEFADVLLVYVKEEMGYKFRGQAASSYAADLLGQPDLSAQKYFDIKWSAASFYSAGSDTTVSVVTAYFLAAAEYPHIQERAQAEMDDVVGRKKLPTFDDRASLPYTDALCKELCRWLPIVPLAAPHRAMKADVYGQYLIPKDAFVMPDIWKFLHNPSIYRDPFVFNLNRFLGPSIHLTDVSVWICIAKVVVGLTISRALDDNGIAIDPVADVTDGIVSEYPK
ncbi:cytochrome P450 [Mycena galopus ATCC 62051]|nr:cytochrome P450 [Mycena galopus ATCC 62051]